MKIQSNKSREKKTFSKWVQDLVYKIRTMSFARHLLLLYFFITMVGAFLLYAPFSQTGNIAWDPLTKNFTKGKIGFVDSLFTAASAFSDTGLVSHTTAIVYNDFGQAIIAILIFVGGIGVFALKVFIFNIIFNRPISFKTRESLRAERGSVKIGVTRDLIKVAIITILSLIIIFSIILSTIFYYTNVEDSSPRIVNNPYHRPIIALKMGIFHTISAINNAGFDIIGTNSLEPYYYSPIIQIIFIILFVIGGMGYGVIYDIYSFLITNKNERKFRFSLFTKISVITYFLISIIGVGTTFIIETNSSESFWQDKTGKYGNNLYKSLAIFFNTMSTRNAGFSTINIHNISKGSMILYTALMFIGSAPSSTAGGIRTTTFAILILGLWSMIRGRKNIYVFKKMIKKETVNRAFIVFTTSILICFIGALISISSLDVFGGKVQTFNNATNHFNMEHLPSGSKPFGFVEIVFEVSSAFGTTGLSTGLTNQLSTISKLSLILIMFIGQLGVSSSILIWGSSKKATDNHYGRTAEDISIG